MGGFSGMFLRFPGEQVTIIVLRNTEMQFYERLEIDLAEIVYSDE